jgi:hypothetical protein
MAAAAKAVGKGFVRVDIERLVTWALRDQGLGWSGNDSFNAASQIALLGTIVDTSPGGSHPNIGLWSSDDALLVKSAIEGLPREAGALLFRYGRAGLRPEYGAEGEGRWEQDVDGGGRLRWDWDDPVNRTGERRPHMVFVGTDPEVIEAERAEYGLWRQGLADIVGPLNAKLAEHVATGPVASVTPWLDAPRVILGVAEVEEVRKVRDEPAADKRARAQDLAQGRATDWSASNSVLHKKESQSRKGASGTR